MLYLDHASLTPVHPAAVKAMLSCMESTFYNPSASYPPAGEARRVVNDARNLISRRIGADVSTLIFTSGATESNNIAVQGVFRGMSQKKHIVLSSIEHPSILRSAQMLEKDGAVISYAPCDHDGVIQPDAVESLLRPDTALVSVQLANPETGVIQPVDQIGAIARKWRIPFHCDASCGFLLLPVDVQRANIDLLTAESTKVGGPPGAGLLYVRPGTHIRPLMYGGYQEYGLRPGTENVPAIVGFAAVVQQADALMEAAGATRALRDLLEHKLLQQLPQAKINGMQAERLPQYSCITIPGAANDRMMAHLARMGVIVSTRSACTALEKRPSHVLTAMGLSHEDAACTLRITLGNAHTKEDMLFAVDCIQKAAALCTDKEAMR